MINTPKEMAQAILKSIGKENDPIETLVEGALAEWERKIRAQVSREFSNDEYHKDQIQKMKDGEDFFKDDYDPAGGRGLSSHE